MKTLNQFITEALIKKVSNKTETQKTVKPKNRVDLIKIINNTIVKQGTECDLNFIDVSEITDMSNVFYYSDFNGDISEWDVSNVTNMSYMFSKSDFTGDISTWDVSNVKDMRRMFDSSNFNGDISEWDVSNVTNMEYMFCCSKFHGDVSQWNMKDDVNTNKTFFGCPMEQHYGETPEIKNGKFVKIK